MRTLRDRLPVFIIMLVGAGIGLLIMSQPTLAQRRSADLQWHYVGLSNTVARIDESSGKVWILKNQKDSGFSLQSRGQYAEWSWEEVQIVEPIKERVPESLP